MGYFLYIPPPPHPLGLIGAALGTAVNKFNSSHKKVSEHYITWLFYIVCQDLEKMLCMAMCIELATQKGWRRYAFPCFISFILQYLSQTERYSEVLWLIWKLI